MEILGYALAALMGLSLGVMGGGGSILTVPIFVYALGFDPKLAIAMSLPVVGATSLIGTVGHWRHGNVHLRMAAIFGAVAMAGAYAGARLAVFLTGAAQLVILAIVMLIAAVSMFRSALGSAPQPAARAGAVQPVAFGLLGPVALGVGLLTGLVGIGGGFLVVPALVLLARVPMKQAVGTSLLVIAMNSASGFAGYLGRVPVPWGVMVAFTAVAAAAIILGSHLIRLVSQRALKQAFAAFLLVVAPFILYKNRNVFRPSSPLPAATATTAR